MNSFSSKKRYLYYPISEDLEQKMVLLDGPRQVGKTTLAQSLGELWKKRQQLFI